MAKVTGIDIGSSSIKLVEIDGSPRKWRVTRVVSMPRSVPQEAEDDTPPPDERELLMTDLKAAWHESGATRDRALVAVSASKCVLRTMALPFRGRDEIRKVLKFEAEGHIHSHAIDDVVVDAQTIEERKDGTELFLVACPKEPLAEQLKLLQKSGCDPEHCDLDAAALVAASDELGVFSAPQAVEGEDAIEDVAPGADGAAEGEHAAVDLVLDLGASSIQMIVVSEGSMRTVRCLRWGLARYMRLDDTGEARPDPSKSAEIAGRILREAQRYLSGLGLDAGARRIFVSGGGARWPELRDAIAQEAGVTVEILDLLVRATSTEGEGGDCDVALAAAVVGLNPARRTFNFRQEELAFRPKFDRLKLPLAIALLIGTVLLFGLAFTKIQTIKRIERQAGLYTEKPPRTKDKKRGRHYTGLMLNILEPTRSARIRGRLRPEHAKRVLDGAKTKKPLERSRWVSKELDKVIKDLAKKTGVYSEIRTESGLSVLQRFSALVDAASKDERVGRFMILEIEVAIGMKKTSPGKFRFKVGFRSDDYISSNAAFHDHCKRFAAMEDTPFVKPLYSGEKRFTSSLDPGGEFAYEFDVVDAIPVLQNPEALR